MKTIDKINEYLNENEIDVVDALAKLLKIDWDSADSKFSGFMSGANLDQKRKYWAALKKSPEAAAKVIKKEWL